MSAIFIFGAVRDLSVALTELRVAIRLCDGVVVGTRIAPCPPHANQHDLDCRDAHSTSEMGQTEKSRRHDGKAGLPSTTDIFGDSQDGR